VDSVYGMGHPGTFHFRELVKEVSNGVYEAGGKPAVFAVSDICDGVAAAALAGERGPACDGSAPPLSVSCAGAVEGEHR
jgi:hypothetical protein